MPSLVKLPTKGQKNDGITKVKLTWIASGHLEMPSISVLPQIIAEILVNNLIKTVCTFRASIKTKT